MSTPSLSRVDERGGFSAGHSGLSLLNRGEHALTEIQAFPLHLAPIGGISELVHPEANWRRSSHSCFMAPSWPRGVDMDRHLGAFQTCVSCLLAPILHGLLRFVASRHLLHLWVSPGAAESGPPPRRAGAARLNSQTRAGVTRFQSTRPARRRTLRPRRAGHGALGARRCIAVLLD
jgi:hypothetical protein